MECQIKRNKNTGKLVDVLAPNGKKSRLYEDLVRRLGDPEEALRMWSLVYTSEFQNEFGKWEGGEVANLDSNGEPFVEDILPIASGINGTTFVNTMFAYGAYTQNEDTGALEEALLDGESAKLIANFINDNTPYTVKVTPVSSTRFVIQPDSSEGQSEVDAAPTRDLRVTRPMIVDYIESDPVLDEMITNQNVSSVQQKETIDKLAAMRRRVTLSEDGSKYVLDGTVELERTSHRISGMKGPDGQEGYYGFDGRFPDKYENNRQWGNQVDDILTGVLMGETDSQIIARYNRGITERGLDGPKLSRTVIAELIKEFKLFKSEHPDAVILNQQTLFNAEQGIAGTADVLIIHKDGSVDVFDLKTSVYPTDEKYSKTGANGKVYTNSYNRPFPNQLAPTKASKRQRHQMQLSMYDGMLKSQGIFTTGNLETIHIHLKGVDETIVTEIAREQNKKHKPVPMQEVAEDSNYEGEVIPDIDKTEEFKEVLDEIRKTLETKRAQFARDGKSAKEFVLTRIRESIEATSHTGAVQGMINEVSNTLNGNSGFRGYFNIVASVTKDIQDKKINDQEALEKLKDARDILDLYYPVVTMMRDFYNDFFYFSRGEGIPTDIDPESPLGKMEALVRGIETHKARLDKVLPEVHANILYPHIRRTVGNLRIEAAKKKKALDDYVAANSENPSKRVAKRIKQLGKEYDSIAAKLITKDQLASMIRDGNYTNVGNFFDVYVNPAVSSSNEIVASFALAVKEAFETARIQSLDFQRDAVEAFEEYKGDDSADNVEEFNKPFYNKVKLFSGLNEEGQPTYRDELQFNSEVDVTAYEQAKGAFEASISELPEDAKSRARSSWYRANRMNLPESDWVANGVVIRAGANTILDQKKQSFIQGYGKAKGTQRYTEWLSKVSTKTPNGVVYTIPELTMPDTRLYPAKHTYTESQQKYADFLLSSYFKSQAKLPDVSKPGFRLPSIVKSDIDRLREKGGVKKTLKYKWDSLAFTQEEDIEVYGETIKAVPVLFTNRMDVADVNLDLIASVLRFEDAANLYQARTKMAPLGDTLLSQLQEGDFIATDSSGKAIIDKAAKSLGIDKGFSSYLKENNGNHVAALLAGFIDMQIYGKYKNKEMAGNLDLGKIADSLITYGSFTNIGGDFMLGVANWLQGSAMVRVEAAAKKYFDTKDWKKGLSLYNKHIPNMIKDFNEPYNKSLIGQLIDLYDPVQGNARDKFGRKVSQSTGKKLMSTDTYFFNMQQGESHVQISTFLALLQREKVKLNGQEIPLFEAYELDADGKIKIKEGIDSPLVRRDVQNTLHSINKSMHGVYNNFDRVIAERHAIGRLLMMYRKFIVPGFKRRFQQYSVNYESGDPREGYYRTFWKSMMTDWKNSLKFMVPFVKPSDVGLTEAELYNMRRSATEFTVIILTAVTAALLNSLREASDDEDAKWALSYPLYWSMRLRSELMYYMNPKDTYRSFRSPTASFGVVEKSIRLIDQLVFEDIPTLSLERYDRDAGIAQKGDPKSLIYFYKLLGVNGRTADPSEAIKVLQLQTN